MTVFAAGLAACSGGTGSPSSAPERSATLAPTASVSASPRPTPTPTHGTFTVTGAPVATINTAVLLQDGRVLGIAGGSSVAQLYDPSTGTFSLTGKMTTERSEVTATLLGDGDVLVVGGGDLSRPEVGAELYDPASATFRPAAPVVTPRILHTATLLKDGRVLIAGGVGPKSAEDYLASAEIYDPATGKFSPTGSMHTAREYATATLLADGRVLILGGDQGICGACDEFNILSSAEIYDPVTGQFSAAGSLPTPRVNYTATLLPGGLVLIAGGWSVNADFTDQVLSECYLYDPANHKFTQTGSMTIERADHTATLLLDGRVLVVSGGGGESGGSAEIYDPATGRFSPTGSLRTGPLVNTATLLKDGRVLMAKVIPLAAELYWP